MRYGIRKTVRTDLSYTGPTWKHITNKNIPKSFCERGVAEYFAKELSKHNSVGFEVFEMEE